MMIGGGGGGDGNMLDKDGLNPCLATGRHNTVHIQIEMNTMNAANKAWRNLSEAISILTILTTTSMHTSSAIHLV